MAGHIMLDLHGLEIDQIEKEILKHPQVGGIILFSRNFESKKQLQALTKSIRKINETCLIAVDQEGGRVQRFRQGFTSLPSFRTYGELYEKDPTHACQEAEKMAYIMAQELIDVGVDLSFTPVLDIDQGVSEVIGDRSFYHEANVIIELARSFIKGMHAARMPATGKHFPGHGFVAADSHTSLPIDNRDFQTIYHQDMQPFIQLNNDLDAIMPAHISYKTVDQNPVCFSNYWLQEILRSKLNFSGVIFSDDLSMAGAQAMGDYAVRSKTALDSGCDMILICNHREQAIKVLDNLENYENDASEERLKTLRKRYYD